MSQVMRKAQKLFPPTLTQAAAALKLSPCPVWGGAVVINQRQYKGRPTHGIGRFRHLVFMEAPKQQKKKKKDWVLMKQIVAATDTSYGTLNVKVSGFDMTLVEHFSRFIHNFCSSLGVKVSECYALPTKSTEIFLMPEQGTKMFVDSMLTTHERVVQVKTLSTSLCPVFLEVLLKNQPEGVDLSVEEHTQADFDARFKERPEMIGLMKQL